MIRVMTDNAANLPPELREHLETRLQEAGIETAGFYELPL